MDSINISEPWFTYIKNKKKKIEGRLNKGKFSLLKKNNIIRINNFDSSMSFTVKIIKIIKYKTFLEYISQESLKRTLPNIKTIEDGIKVYRKYYSKEDEEKYGILAIYIKIV